MTNNPSLIKTTVVLEIPNIRIDPSIRVIEENFQKVIQNIIEVSYLIKCWGEEAKTPARATRPPSPGKKILN